MTSVDLSCLVKEIPQRIERGPTVMPKVLNKVQMMTIFLEKKQRSFNMMAAFRVE